MKGAFASLLMINSFENCITQGSELFFFVKTDSITAFERANQYFWLSYKNL